MTIISEPTPSTIPVNNLRDGQIAVIVKWNGMTNYVGKIIQRYHNALVCLGEEGGWPDFIEGRMKTHGLDFSEFQVRVLKSGTKLEI